MRQRITWFAVVLLALMCQRAHAVIMVKTPLKSIESNSDFIVVGKVEKYFADKPAMMISVTEDIKGKFPHRDLPMNLKVADEKAFKDNQIEPLLKRLGPDLEVIFFLQPRGKSYITFAFANGTWFQLQGTKVAKDEVVFALKSAEPYFRKSFKGTTEELRKLLKEHAAGKAKLPEFDDKATPGFGPEYSPRKGAARPHNPRASLRSGWDLSGDNLFAVIPTIGIGAPLAILALLFPTVFGGVFVLFRQWMAFITLISVNSTLLIVHFLLLEYFPSVLRGTWWESDSSLWIIMTAVTFVCLLWAWRRQLDFLASGDAAAPRRVELGILLFMSVTGLATTAVLWSLTTTSWTRADWTLTVVMSLAIVVGTLYRVYHACRHDGLFDAPPLPTEGVILGAMLFGHVLFVPAIWGQNVDVAGKAGGSEQSGEMTGTVAPVVKAWEFTVNPRIKGMYASSPLVHGDSVYAAYYGTNQYSTLVRLDRQTGLQKWEFLGKNDDLRQMISSPCIADGRLYFGEGFHDDKNCRVFCVDAEKGEEIWTYQTAGQTESSPAVVNDKVYIGAGNEGVHCLDAKTGKPIWQYPKSGVKTPRIQRFCGAMVVVSNRLYCGTGVDRNVKIGDKGESATFCLDATTGDLLWKTGAPYPVWSTPIVKEGTVYVGSGNGDVIQDAEPPEVPGGAVQCLDAMNGSEKWIAKFGNGVIEAPAVDSHRLYVGCRTGDVFCIRRDDGKPIWQNFLGSPIVATPVLDSDPVYGRTLSVFATPTAGKVCCLHPRTGDVVWTYDLTAQNVYITSSPRLLVTRTPDGYRRQLFFGAGVGGGWQDALANRPVVYCLEDKIRVE